MKGTYNKVDEVGIVDVSSNEIVVSVLHPSEVCCLLGRFTLQTLHCCYV
jgi:hypothetical protein